MAETVLVWNERRVELRRPHTAPKSPFRAWSAADVLAADQVAGASMADTLVVNDAWGALSVLLADRGPTIWTDSALSRHAIADNLELNGLTEPTRRFVRGDNMPPPRAFDTAVILPPKQATLAAHFARGAATALRPGSSAIASVMSKQMTPAVLDALGAGFAVVQPRRAVGKARLIDLAEPRAHEVEPITTYAFTTEHGVEVHTAPGVFAERQLDTATSLLLDQVIASASTIGMAQADLVVDLGCGSGVIGATLAARCAVSQLAMLDVSDVAIAAAKATWRANDLDPDAAAFHVVDGASALADGSADLVVTNPPYHQGHAVDHGLAHRLVRDAARVLRPSGSLIVVTHRSVELHTTLHRAFGHVEARTKHPSFVVLVASQPKQLQ